MDFSHICSKRCQIIIFQPFKRTNKYGTCSKDGQESVPFDPSEQTQTLDLTEGSHTFIQKKVFSDALPAVSLGVTAALVHGEFT